MSFLFWCGFLSLVGAGVSFFLRTWLANGGGDYEAEGWFYLFGVSIVISYISFGLYSAFSFLGG